MAAFPTTLQLLVLGALVSPAYLQAPCEVITNTTQLGSYNVSLSPSVYKTNTTYNVTIRGIATNSSVILQALNSQNASVGQWIVDQWAVLSVNCSNGTVVNIQNITDNATVQWTSPSNETGPVDIRVFQVLTNGSALLQKATLNAVSTTPPTSTQTSITTSTSSTTSRGSVSTTQASSFLVAVVHLLSVLATGKLFS
nr:placenta-expressed transcript 1 protein-like [Pelodiscus sinensis]|eukprot:XP_014428116.1 placenta-expressed transcript 1 protein-like [Pelodiscus sinensis]